MMLNREEIVNGYATYGYSVTRGIYLGERKACPLGMFAVIRGHSSDYYNFLSSYFGPTAVTSFVMGFDGGDRKLAFDVAAYDEGASYRDLLDETK